MHVGLYFSHRVATTIITIQGANERTDREYLGRPVARHSAEKCMSVFLFSYRVVATITRSQVATERTE